MVEAKHRPAEPKADALKRTTRKRELSSREPPKEWEAINADLYAEVKESKGQTDAAATALVPLFLLCLLWAWIALDLFKPPTFHVIGATLLAVASVVGISLMGGRHKRIYLEVEAEIEKIKLAIEKPLNLPASVTVTGRGIIQVFPVRSIGTVNGNQNSQDAVVALCVDGSTWLLEMTGEEPQWKKLPEIPSS
ncbi:hypothetical protein LJR290_007975 [Variovorax sp. LjRoot290]|uniref:hypothetical protein n=1 Tax=Variovorax sp. LjRoot290 TaxID=3342316 RepID=UPI003ECD3590